MIRIFMHSIRALTCVKIAETDFDKSMVNEGAEFLFCLFFMETDSSKKCSVDKYEVAPGSAGMVEFEIDR